MKRVLFFGTFDPLHPGHSDAFVQAKSLGDYLTVVVARDSTIQREKKRVAFSSEHERLAYVAASHVVDEAILGDSDAAQYRTLREIPADILALGYDQQPPDALIPTILKDAGVPHIRPVRLQSFHPNKHKSSLLRFP